MDNTENNSDELDHLKNFENENQVNVSEAEEGKSCIHNGDRGQSTSSSPKKIKNEEDDEEKNFGLSLLETLPQMDSAKQFKNLSLVIIFTALTVINYIVPNVKLVIDYSGPAENDRYVRMTLAYMIAPIFITTMVNLAWYIDDDLHAKDEGLKRPSRKTWYIRIAFLVLQMGTVLRFGQSLYYGYKSKHTQGSEKSRNQKKMSLLEKDATLLRSFTSFMQGVPQFALQVYILLEGPENILKRGVTWQFLSISGSLCAITWAAVSCDRILGSKSTEETISDWRIIAMLLPWRFFTIAARMTTIALFTTLHPAYFGLGCVGHYAIMYLLIQHQKVATHNGTRSEVFLFLVGGLVYIITDLLVKYERSYHKYLIYYGIVFAENFIMLSVWYFYCNVSPQWIKHVIVLGVTISFFIGIFFLRLYYEFSHPRVTKYCLCNCCQTTLLLNNDETISSSSTPNKK